MPQGLSRPRSMGRQISIETYYIIIYTISLIKTMLPQIYIAIRFLRTALQRCVGFVD